MASMSSSEISAALQAAIVASLPKDDDNDNWVYVDDFTDEWVVYYSDGQDWQQSYSMDADGNVTLTGEPEIVRPMTTYVPVDTKSVSPRFESRGVPQSRSMREVRSPRVEITHEPLTYRRDARASYFRDFIFKDTVPGAAQRLERHASEMDVLRKTREKAQAARFAEGGFETRIEPNRTEGYGGYFSPPAWLNDLFATGKHSPRVLSDLIRAAGGAFQSISAHFRQREAWRSPPGTSDIGMSPASQRPA